MKGTKTCWNLACICWIDEPDTSNCMTEDIEPQDCGLADLDMRSIINIIDIKIKNRLKKITPGVTRNDNVPDTVTFWYMHDNHTFTKLTGRDLNEIIEQCHKVREKSPYGMLCPVTLFKGDRQIRKVGEGVHCHGLLETAKWLIDVGCWEAEVKRDADIMRLLVSDRFKHEGRR